MDPFSITAAAIGVADVAVSRIIGLHNTINHLAGVKEEIQDIYSSLGAIQRPLTALESLTASNELVATAIIEDLKKAGVADAVNQCANACEKFGKSLLKWTRHSTDARVSFRDHLAVGIWNKEKVSTFRTQVQSCQATVHFAVTSAQLHIQLRAEMESTSAQGEVLQRFLALQNDVQQHLELTKTQQEKTQQKLQELSIEPDDEEDDGSQREAALGEVRSRSEVLEADQVSSGVIYAQVHSHVTRQSIEDITTSDNSTALVGLPRAVVGKIDQRIRGVCTTKNSKAAVGVFQDAINMNDF